MCTSCNENNSFQRDIGSCWNIYVIQQNYIYNSAEKKKRKLRYTEQILMQILMLNNRLIVKVYFFKRERCWSHNQKKKKGFHSKHMIKKYHLKKSKETYLEMRTFLWISANKKVWLIFFTLFSFHCWIIKQQFFYCFELWNSIFCNTYALWYTASIKSSCHRPQIACWKNIVI